MHSRAEELIEYGDKLFERRQPMMQLCQELAEQFYPERADFTVLRSYGDDFANHLVSSGPVLARRALADQFGGMLRSRAGGKKWFNIAAKDDRLNKDPSVRRWCEEKTDVQWRATYDPDAAFERATKEADHDIASFGWTPITVETDLTNTSLLYRTWHPRDVAFCENYRGKIDAVYRKWKPDVRTVCALFPKTVHPNVSKRMEKDKYGEVDCYHIVIASEEYDGGGRNGKRLPFVNLYIDIENKTILDERGHRRNIYVIPRWKPYPGSSYAISPAALAAAPSARVVQELFATMLTAGEKAADPPLVGRREALRGDMNYYAGGMTWADLEAGEDIRQAIMQLPGDKSGLSFAMDMSKVYSEAIVEAFYLNKINLPPMDAGRMTATEIRARIDEYLRVALPLFEPLESEYNAGLCENTFGELMDQGTFGDMAEWPDALRSAEVEFQFDSPIRAAADRAKAESYKEALGIIAMGAQIDPSVKGELKIGEATKDALIGIGAPAEWLPTKEEREQEAEAAAQMQKMMQMISMASQGAGAVKEVGEAAGAINEGFAPPEGMDSTLGDAMGGMMPGGELPNMDPAFNAAVPA